MSDSPPKLPDLHREQLALDELPPARRDAVRARLGDAADVEIAALRADDAAILATYPPARIRAEVERRAAVGRTSSRPLVWFGAPALAAAAIVLLVLNRPGDDPALAPGDGTGAFVPAADPGTTRIKGLEPHLVLHRQDGAAAVQLQEPAEARAADVLQVSYVAAGAAHGVVVSLDGGGLVTLHFPVDPADSTALAQGGAVRLAQAYELDAAPGFERFVLVTAAAPIDPARVVAAAHDLSRETDASTRPLALPEGWQQASFLVRKVGR